LGYMELSSCFCPVPAQDPWVSRWLWSGFSICLCHLFQGSPWNDRDRYVEYFFQLWLDRHPYVHPGGRVRHYGGYNNTLYFTTYSGLPLSGGLAITTIMPCRLFSHQRIQYRNGCYDEYDSLAEMKNTTTTHAQCGISRGRSPSGHDPPSIVLVVYGIYTGQSIGSFFLEISSQRHPHPFIAATVIYICYRHPDWGPRDKSTWKERWRALPDAIDIIILFLIIMIALLPAW